MTFKPPYWHHDNIKFSDDDIEKFKLEFIRLRHLFALGINNAPNDQLTSYYVNDAIRPEKKFNNHYIRIDILERLFVQIINSDTKDMKEIKIIPEMLNLLGCKKDDFKQLLRAMSYKILEKDNEVFFKYNPKKRIKLQNKENVKENPFGVLKNLNLN